MEPTIEAQLMRVAERLAEDPLLDARDRNALIGKVRGIVGEYRGLQGLPGFKQAPFAPTTK